MRSLGGATGDLVTGKKMEGLAHPINIWTKFEASHRNFSQVQVLFLFLFTVQPDRGLSGGCPNSVHHPILILGRWPSCTKSCCIMSCENGNHDMEVCYVRWAWVSYRFVAVSLSDHTKSLWKVGSFFKSACLIANLLRHVMCENPQCFPTLCPILYVMTTKKKG